MRKLYLGIAISLMLWAGATSSAQAPQAPKTRREQLKELVKFAISHEGCRIYAADNSIGDIDQIRECFLAVYQGKPEQQQSIRAAKQGSLLAAVRDAAREIAAEPQLKQTLAQVCARQGMLQKFLELKEVGEFETIRYMYYESEKNDPNAKNLLAAVSDEALGDLISSLR